MPKLFRTLKKAGYFIPFTLHFVVFMAVLIFGYMKLRSLSKLPDSAYTGIFELLLSVALYVSTAINCLGFITVASSFMYFKWKDKKNNIDLKLSINTESFHKSAKQANLQIHPILLPLMGFLKIRLVYDKRHISDKISPVSVTNTFFNFSFNGRFNWSLPQIREYQVEKVMIYFEDFFQFFSFVVTIDTSGRFFISPLQQDLQPLSAFPRKTEETTVRIEELKRVEGELINYKNFETNDDVRRIVWKIYARNKELVVRIPEIMDPYASHVYLYASFHSDFTVTGNNTVEIPFLNYYKTICWSVYKQLSEKGLEVRYVADQPVSTTTVAMPEEIVRYSVAISNWQHETSLKEFIKPGSASVVVVSSLSNAEQVRAFIESHGSGISFVFVPLTSCFKQVGVKDWVKWLFIESEDHYTSLYKAKWNASPLRFKLKENEKELMAIMNQATKATII